MTIVNADVPCFRYGNGALRVRVTTDGMTSAIGQNQRAESEKCPDPRFRCENFGAASSTSSSKPSARTRKPRCSGSAKRNCGSSAGSSVSTDGDADGTCPRRFQARAIRRLLAILSAAARLFPRNLLFRAKLFRCPDGLGPPCPNQREAWLPSAAGPLVVSAEWFVFLPGPQQLGGKKWVNSHC
jgi:hypothetical protein